MIFSNVIQQIIDFIQLSIKQTVQKLSYVLLFFVSKVFPINYNNLINVIKNEINKYNKTTIQNVINWKSQWRDAIVNNV